MNILDQRNRLFIPDFKSVNSVMREKYSRKSRNKDKEARNKKFRSLGEKLKKKRIDHMKQNFLSRQFMTECYLTSPQYVSNDFLVIPRPSGKRCMLLAHDGITTSFDKNGMLMYSYSPGIQYDGSSKNIVLIDCIYSEAQNIYYALDLLCWKTQEFYEYPAECRFYFLHSYLAEISTDLNIKMLPIFEVSLESVRNAYYNQFGYEKDGMIFYHKDSSYILGINPDVMIWKDENCSLYPLSNISEQIEVVLFVKNNGELLTLDGYVLGTVDIEMFHLHHGNLVKCRIEGVNIGVNNPEVISLEVLQKASFRRGKADHWSKILYQYLSRVFPITFQDILVSLENNDPISTSEPVHFGNYLYPSYNV